MRIIKMIKIFKIPLLIKHPKPLFDEVKVISDCFDDPSFKQNSSQFAVLAPS